MTIIFDLPGDLVAKILSKVPITYIGVVRSTCKQWNGLSKEQIMCNVEAKRHQYIGFMVKNYKICSMRFDLEEEFVDPSIKEIIIIGGGGGGDSLVEVTKVFHCDGLLLCVTKEKDNEKTEEEEDKTRGLVVWNPYLGQTRLIKPRNKYHIFDRYALGYDKSHKHKILRFLDEYDDFGNHSFAYEIYDFSSDSWRVLDFTPDWDSDFYQRGVSLKGNAYFFAKEKREIFKEPTEEIAELPDFLLCFDFRKESFGPPLSLPFQHYRDDTGTLSCLRDEKLAALYQCLYEYDVEIWVTSKIDDDDEQQPPNALSWVPFIRIDMEPFVGIDFQFGLDGASFFIDEEKKVAAVFHLDGLETTWLYDTAYIIGDNNYFKKVVLGQGFLNHYEYANVGEYSPLLCSCSYVPSLVHIN